MSDHLHSEGCLEDPEGASDAGYSTYMLDDLAVMLTSVRASRAAPDAGRAAELIYQYLLILGIRMDTQACTTEAIVAWHGRGS